MKRVSGAAICVVLALFGLGIGCGEDGEAGPDAMEKIDRDGDGVSPEEGDCNDFNRFMFPGAPDPCDGIDNNCDGVADEDFDHDGDLWTTCAGDCRDNDPNSYPGAREVLDGFDNDCDGIADNNTEQSDDDGDGYSEDQGDCNDDPDTGGALISPGAVEVQLNGDGDPEGFDNDCDGIVDEALDPCPTLPESDARAFASAVDACHFVTSAEFGVGTDSRARGVFADYGPSYVPRTGPDFAVISSGTAGDKTDPGWVELSPGTNLGNSANHPDPQGPIGCSSADDPQVNDLSDFTLKLLVPANANAFSFDFNFMSAEFPEFVCTSFDDTFLAMLESQAFTGNVSFDANGNRVSINVGFFSVCSLSLDPVCTGDADLMGTGYEGSEGGGTGWLTTTAPVIPGEKITLRFSVHDEGDHILDSAVIIDNFRWEIEEVDGPVTVPITVAPQSRFVHASDLPNGPIRLGN